jgi:diguanylate cyclase (GGDEF)-like protein
MMDTDELQTDDLMQALEERPISRFLFGGSARQRRLIGRTTLAGVVGALLLILHYFEVQKGLMTSAQLFWLTVVTLSGTAVFYVLLRFGMGSRLGASHNWTFAQQFFGIVVMVWTFAVVGPDRAAVIGLLVLILIFGVFAFRPREMVGLAVLTLAMLAAAMFWQHLHDRFAPPVSVSIFQFCYAALAIGPVCVISSQINGLQRALAGKKEALENALEQIRRLAESDDLTGLMNRRAMAAMMRLELRGQHKVPPTIAIALIDIDFFKSVNDKYGHQMGDEVLRRFAEVGKSTLRAGDMFARWGGEEFLMMLQDTSAKQGMECLERVRHALAATSFDDISPGLRITISAGVTDLHLHDTLERAVERADQAMYGAKQSGRDRVILGVLHAELADCTVCQTAAGEAPQAVARQG